MVIDRAERDHLVKTFAYEYVKFNHDPSRSYLVTNITDGNLLELEGMAGEFAPHLFQLCDATELVQARTKDSGKWCKDELTPAGIVSMRSIVAVCKHDHCRPEERALIEQAISWSLGYSLRPDTNSIDDSLFFAVQKVLAARG